MALFGNLGQPMMIPGYGGGMFDPQSGMGGMSAGLDQALAQNKAMGAAQAGKPKKGFGEFLRMFAGTLGDSLTGNPVYSQAQQHQQEMKAQEEWYERKRQDELADYEAKKNIDSQYDGPEMPGLAKEVQWINSLPPPEREQAMKYIQMLRPGNFVPPAPVNIPYGATVSGGGGGAGPAPGTVEDGYRFKGGNPADPNAWEPVNGGPSPQGSAGFPRPF
jgi:hypothetical protein